MQEVICVEHGKDILPQVLPRHVQYAAGRLAWDSAKVIVRCELTDALFLKNAFFGRICTADIYPLVYDDAPVEAKGAHVRSLSFFRSCLADPALLTALDDEDKSSLYAGLRDLFISSSHGLLSSEEKDLLRAVVDLVDEDAAACLSVQGLALSPFPNRCQRLVRFVDMDSSSSDDLAQLGSLFVRNALGQLLGFAAPADLSYHNLENILPLDKYFSQLQPPLALEVEAGSWRRLREGLQAFSFSLPGLAPLLALDQAGLYSEPLNSGSRGGQRAILSSNVLSSAVFAALQGCEGFRAAGLQEDFQAVNRVFRLNRFLPGGSKFASHFDTPFIDSENSLASRYTLLLYLTGGRGSSCSDSHSSATTNSNSSNPVLSIGSDFSLEAIPALSGILFDQRLEHEGHAFADGNKVFLRTELIYRSDLQQFDAEVAKCFSAACYLTKLSLFAPTLEKEANDLFNRVVQARYRLCEGLGRPLAQLSKVHSGVRFVTDGYDFWFPPSVDLCTAAVVAILDYFGGECHAKVTDKTAGKGKGKKTVAKRKRQQRDGEGSHAAQLMEVLATHLASDEEVYAYLAAQPAVKEVLDVQALSTSALLVKHIETAEKPPRHVRKKSNDGEDDEDDEVDEDEEGNPRGTCCAFHYSGDPEDDGNPFVPERSQDVLDSFASIDKYLCAQNRQRIGSATLFNGELFVNIDDIAITPHHITFPKTGAFRGINFASCWNGCHPNWFIKTDPSPVHAFRLPDIPYTSTADGHHLCLDMFRNGYILEQDTTLYRCGLGDDMHLDDGCEDEDVVDWAWECTEHGSKQCWECSMAAVEANDALEEQDDAAEEEKLRQSEDSQHYLLM